MTDAQKLNMVKTLLEDGGEMPSDTKLNAYIELAGKEILNWIYHLVGNMPDGAEVPAEYEVTQIYAVVAGYTHAGAEGQRTHNENGISRTFVYADMLDYIRQNVLAIARVGAVRYEDT